MNFTAILLVVLMTITALVRAGDRFVCVPARGSSIVVVASSAGSMADCFTAVRREIAKTVDSLKAADTFDVMFFSDGEPTKAGDQLIVADAAGKEKARAFVDAAKTDGNCDPVPAIKSALALKPDLIYLLTDQVPDADALKKAVEAGDPDGRTHINIVYVAGADDAKIKPDTAALKPIAEAGHGQIVVMKKSDMVAIAAEPVTRPTTLPSMYYVDDTHIARPHAKDPSVIKFDGRYLMYYSVPPKTRTDGWGIGIAESRNLDHWKKVGEMLPEQEIEKKGICAPGARVIDGKVHLFYQNYTASPHDAICHAWSTDGIHFDRDKSNPIFHPTGAWNNGRAIDAEVIAWHDKLWLFCATRDPEGKIQMITGATADPHGELGRGHWTQIGTSPLLKPELGWEKTCIEAPTVAVRGDTLVMFYAGAYNNAPQQIGSAISTDGITWKRQSDQPLIPNGKPGEWNESESGHPGYFLDDDGKSHLFYQGNNDKGRTWYLSRLELNWKDDVPSVKKS